MNKLWLIPIAIPLLLLGYWVTKSYELPTYHVRKMTIDRVDDSANYYLVYGRNNEVVQLDKLWFWEYSTDIPALVSEAKQRIGEPVSFGCYGFTIGQYEEDMNTYPAYFSDCGSLL